MHKNKMKLIIQKFHHEYLAMSSAKLTAVKELSEPFPFKN